MDKRRLMRLGKDGILILISVVVLLPFIWMMSTALKGSEEVFSYPPTLIPKKLDFSNFTEVIKKVPIGRGYINSLVVSISITLLQLVTSSLGAYAFSKIEFPGRDKIFFLYITTLIVPSHITMIPIFIVMRELPELLNTWLHTDIFTRDFYLGGLLVGKIVGPDSYVALVLPYAVSPYGTFLLRQYFLNIPDDIIEAAKMDGCSHGRIYLSIVVPLSKPALATLATFTFMNAWKNYMWPLVMINEPNMMPLSVMLQWLQGVYTAEWPLLMAASILVLLPIGIFFVVNQRYLERGIQTNVYF